jgi:hypothetical protein
MRSARQHWPPCSWWGLLLVTAAGCTPLTEDASCAHGCPRPGQACDVVTQLCVDVRPQVRLTSPLADAGVDGGLVPVLGRVTFFDDAGPREVSAALPDGGWEPLALDGGAFAALIPVPERNGASYPLSVLAVDTAGRQGMVSVQVWLDQIPPRGVLSPEHAARATDSLVRVVFDEAVVPAGAGPAIDLVPADGRGHFIDGGYVISGLAFLTTYTASVPAGAMLDTQGNPSRRVDPVVFTTGASPPSSPTLRNAGQVVDVDATSDEDGVVTVVVQVDGGAVTLYSWGTFDGRTGDFQVLDQASDSAADVFQAVGAAAGDGGVPLLRTTGFFKGSLSSTTLRSAEWRAGGVSGSQSTGALALIPTGPSCVELPGADPVGLVVTGSPELYLRAPGSLALPAPTLPARLGVRSADGWELVSVAFEALDRVVFRPWCPPAAGPAFSAQSAFRTGVRSPPRLSVALPPADRSLYVYDGVDGQRIEFCDACVGAPSDAGCPASFERVTRAGLTAATRRSGGRVLAAALDGGVIELLERDLSTSCSTAWESLGVLPGSAGAIRWVPVLFGARPGAVYATSTQVRAEVLP